MSICDSGIRSKVLSKEITINVPQEHELLVLANKLPWEEMYELVKIDLKNSTVFKTAYYGRKLKVRTHIGVYLLQKIKNVTDREIEFSLRGNAAYQLFCGNGIVENWQCPDHTKIERFRSRLTPATQQKLANLLCQKAVKLGLADSENIDVDSTVQEANMTYPTDAKMLRKLGNITRKVADGLKKILPIGKQELEQLNVDLKTIASKARSCFFVTKQASKEEKSRVLEALLEAVSEPVQAVSAFCRTISEEMKKELPWNIRQALNQLLLHGESYLSSVKEFIKTGGCEVTKRLSFHLNEVCCFNKKKEHKKYEFGRAFQLVRLAGNFLFVAKSQDVRMDDKKSLLPVVDEYKAYFETDRLNSVATDKGYYSHTNVKTLTEKNITQVGVQVPVNTQNKYIPLSEQEWETLNKRRAGIEPLIGHTKQGGQLGKSRMKNDRNIEASGYGAVLGFNLRQLIRAFSIKQKAQIPLGSM